MKINWKSAKLCFSIGCWFLEGNQQNGKANLKTKSSWKNPKMPKIRKKVLRSTQSYMKENHTIENNQFCKNKVQWRNGEHSEIWKKNMSSHL